MQTKISTPQNSTAVLQEKIEELESELTRAEHRLAAYGLSLGADKEPGDSQILTIEKYQTLVENANDAILVAQDNRFAFFNRRTSELTGYSYEELRDLPFIKLIHPDDRAMVVERYQKRLAGEPVPDIYTFRAIKKDGTDFWVEIHAVRITWLDNPAILCFLTDISRYKSTETHLAESEQRYRTIVELSPYGILTMDTKGIIQSVNSAFTNLTGFTAEDFVGCHLSRIPTLRLQDAPQFTRLFARLIKIGFDEPIEFSWIHKDGTERWAESRGVLLHSGNKIVGLQAIIRDITEQRRATLLMEALNSTAHAVALETNPQAIFTVMGNQLSRLGIACAVLMTCTEGKFLKPDYVSYKPRAIRLVEKLVKSTAEKYLIDISEVEAFRDVIWERRTILASNPIKAARQMLPSSLQHVASQLIQILDVKTSINAPLIIEDKVVGMLSVQSDTLRDVDIPTITAFANLIAAALHKARLLLQAQSELEERRRAEGEILRLEHLLQNITDAMPSALITVDTDGCVLTSNPSADKLLNQEGAFVPGQILWHIDPSLAFIKTVFEEVIATQDVANLYHKQINVQDTLVYLDIEAFPLLEGALQGVVFRIDNVTEFVHLQDVMLQSAKLASLGGLAAGVAHEINNPLAAMIQSAQMIQQILDSENTRSVTRMRNAGVNPAAMERYVRDRHILNYVEGIREAGGRAAKIVKDLLAFSRKSSLEMSPVQLNDIIEAALELAAKDYSLIKHFDFRDIEVVLNLDSRLPLVLCDQQQIQQVVLNLLLNATQALATKFERDQAFHPHLILQTTLKDGVVGVSIEDNGVGIEAATMDHIFEPFFTTKQVGEGTGLGLWLCWSIIVERHHGQIWAEPLMDSGARFVFELPVNPGNSL